MQQTLQQIPQLLQTALSTGAIDVELHTNTYTNTSHSPENDFAKVPPPQVQQAYNRSSGRGRCGPGFATGRGGNASGRGRGGRADSGNCMDDSECHRDDFGVSAEHECEGRGRGRGRRGNRQGGFAAGRGRGVEKAVDHGNGCGTNGSEGGRGRRGGRGGRVGRGSDTGCGSRGGRQGGRGRNCDGGDSANVCMQDKVVGNENDVCNEGCGRGGADMKQPRTGRGRGRYSDVENARYGGRHGSSMHGAVGVENDVEGVRVDKAAGRGGRGGRWGSERGRAIGESAGCGDRRSGWDTNSMSFHACSHTENEGRCGGQGGRGVQGKGRGGGGGGPGSNYRDVSMSARTGQRGYRRSAREGVGCRGNIGGEMQGQGARGGYTGVPHQRDWHGEHGDTHACRQQGRSRWNDRERSPHRSGGGRQGQQLQHRKRGKRGGAAGQQQDTVSDCYKVPQGLNGHYFDPREIPTALYLASNKEASRRFLQEHRPQVVRLADVKASGGQLPIATASSHFDVMEHYFSSVEEVSQDPSVEWVKAWGTLPLLSIMGCLYCLS